MYAYWHRTGQVHSTRCDMLSRLNKRGMNHCGPVGGRAKVTELLVHDGYHKDFFRTT
jgi:hypothetical protein